MSDTPLLLEAEPAVDTTDSVLHSVDDAQNPDTVIGPAHNGMLMTAEEFDAHTEWDEFYVYELVHGVLLVSPSPLPTSRGPNQRLGHWLLTYQEQHPSGKVLDGTLDENDVRTLGNRRRADRVIWTGLGRVPNFKTDVPTIAVEFVSAGTRNRRRDYVEKRTEYLTEGVKEYWIIDRFRRTMTVCRADGDRVVLEQEVYQTTLLPGFELPLSKLLAEADQWKNQ